MFLLKRRAYWISKVRYSALFGFNSYYGYNILKRDPKGLSLLWRRADSKSKGIQKVLPVFN